MRFFVKEIPTLEKRNGGTPRPAPAAPGLTAAASTFAAAAGTLPARWAPYDHLMGLSFLGFAPFFEALLLFFLYVGPPSGAGALDHTITRPEPPAPIPPSHIKGQHAQAKPRGPAPAAPPPNRPPRGQLRQPTMTLFSLKHVYSSQAILVCHGLFLVRHRT